jgi:cold shock protein
MQRELGVVRCWIAEKGFGFIRPHGADHDTFVHVRALQGGLTELCPGQRVSYVLNTDFKTGGLQARDVQVVGE